MGQRQKYKEADKGAVHTEGQGCQGVGECFHPEVKMDDWIHSTAAEIKFYKSESVSVTY